MNTMNKIKFYKTPKAKYTYYITQGNQAYRVVNTEGLCRIEYRTLVNKSTVTNYTYDRIADFIIPVNHIAEKAVEIETIPTRLKKSFMYYTTVADNRRYKFKKYQDKKQLIMK